MNHIEAAIDRGQKSLVAHRSQWEDSYRPLPFLFFGLLIVWTVLVGVWTFNTWSKRQWQTNNLQWVLTAVPVMKALVLGLSFVFWYSCLNLSTCSFWVAFGVFVTRIFFETACFIAFLLISHGYCIMHEQLSVSERRSIAGLASLLYLTLTGYKAAVPQFAVLVVLIYFILLYTIFLHVDRNLTLLQEQLHHIQEDGVQMMHSAVYTKYKMFKNFQGSMLIMVVVKVLMYVRADTVPNEYWMKLLICEWTEIGIFFYMGWTFRSREVTPFFTVIPILHSQENGMLPPIYRIEMNQNDFNNLDVKEWHIGVPTSLSKGESNQPMIVFVQNPGQASFQFSEDQCTTLHTSDNTSKRTAATISLYKSRQASMISSYFSSPPPGLSSAFNVPFSSSPSLMNHWLKEEKV